MNAIHYIGLDVHKKTIAYCIKTSDGQIVEEDTLQAQRTELRRWAKRRQVAWQGAMEATLFSVWIDDTLKPYAQHSAITPAELRFREAFYINMVWVVDRCREELDAAHFNLNLGGRINEGPAVHSGYRNDSRMRRTCDKYRRKVRQIILKNTRLTLISFVTGSQ